MGTASQSSVNEATGRRDDGTGGRWADGTSVRRSVVPPARRPAGFTLIEILVVITVIAILAGLVTPMVFGHVSDARMTEARAQIESFGLALESYRLDSDYYPSTAQGLNALVTLPVGPSAPRNWRGPYLRKGIPVDPWGRPYLYVSPGTVNPQTYELLSLGRDGRPGGTGEDADISSWEAGAP